MRFSTVAAALLPVAGVLAEEFVVKVGDNGLDFNPTSVMANAGDSITFQFVAKNHSVTQSSFNTPCVSLSDTSIDSGFMPVTDGPLNYSVPVNDSNPVWFYCKQILNGVPHCVSGMVFALNPTADKTFDAFQTAAKDSGNATTGSSSSNAPGPSGSASPSGAPGASGSASPSGSSSGSSSPSGSGSAPGPSGSGNPNGAPRVGTTTAVLVSAVGLVAGMML